MEMLGSGAADRPDRPRVLLVEDDPQLRRSTGSLLASLGVQVVLARDGEDAIRILARIEARFDAAMIDCGLPPPMSGVALARLILAGTSLRRVVLTSGLDRASVSEAIPDRARWLDKPYSRADLVGALGVGMLPASASSGS